jgi:ribosomal protein S18 acetylase RimI-like enzyme
MLLERVVEADYAAVVALANLAYRGTGEQDAEASASWNVETGLIEGPRLTEASLREELEEKPELLVWREEPAEPGGPRGPLMGTVWMQSKGEGVWYLGLLTVRPEVQNRQLGRTLLAAAESYAKERGGRKITMTVLSGRDALMAWYERRGYRKTGETQPYPYGDGRIGRPLRDDLHFVVMEKSFAESCADGEGLRVAVRGG